MNLTGRTAGGVELVRPIGAGAAGEVYEGLQRSLDRRVAVKFLSQDRAVEAEFVERFLREARSAARLNHPNIVHVYDAGATDASRGEPEGLYYIVMELVTGGSLKERIESGGRPPSVQVLRWMREAAEGLGCAHRAGLVHRDVKPGNLMVAPDGTLKVADFGLARSGEAASALTQSGTVLGTPSYMSPEQCEGREADARSDLYSVGATFCHVMTGAPPFEAETVLQVMYKHAHAPRPVIEAPDELGGRLAAVVTRLLAVSPDERYAGADELLAELGRIERGQAPSSVARPASSGRGFPTTGPYDVTEVLPGAAPGPAAAGEEVERRGDRLAEKGQWALAASAYREALALSPGARRVEEKLLACDGRAREESLQDLMRHAEKLEGACRYAEAADYYGRALRAAGEKADQDRARRKLAAMLAASKRERFWGSLALVLRVPLAAATVAGAALAARASTEAGAAVAAGLSALALVLSKSGRTRRTAWAVLKLPLAAGLLAVTAVSGMRISETWSLYQSSAAGSPETTAAAGPGDAPPPGAPGPGAPAPAKPGPGLRPAAPQPAGNQPAASPPQEPAQPPAREPRQPTVASGTVPAGPSPKVEALKPPTEAPPASPANPWAESLDQFVPIAGLSCSFSVPVSWAHAPKPPPGVNFAMRRDYDGKHPAGLVLRVLRIDNVVPEEYAKGLEHAMETDPARQYMRQFANRLVVGGSEAFEFSGKYDEENRRVQCLVTVVRGKGLLYEAKMSCLAEDFPEAKDLFRRIMKTFQVKD